MWQIRVAFGESVELQDESRLPLPLPLPLFPLPLPPFPFFPEVPGAASESISTARKRLPEVFVPIPCYFPPIGDQ